MRMLRSILCVVPLVALVAAATASADPIGFAPKSFVSTTLAGGEPLVFADTKHGTLVYTSHEGTTHLYRNGLATIPVNWLANYRDQVNTWYSKDNGKTWSLAQLSDPSGTVGTGFNETPAQNLGFSDPDLTQDAGGRIYNTGIDLANDAIFSSADGGVTWDKGTAMCHDGDRPWLAASDADTAFLASNTEEGGHQIFTTTDGGNTCQGGDPTAAGISDPGGNGKLFWNPVFKELVEPNTSGGVGVATWKPGEAKFTQQPKVYKGSIFAHWPSIAIDKAGTLYMVWDTANGANGQGCPSTITGGAANTASTKPNQVQYAYSKDDGRTWSKVVTVMSSDHGFGNVEFWPWVVAGDAGRINITWYEANRAVDIDCAPVSVDVLDTTIVGADQDSPSFDVVDASHGPVHIGTVCQGGTTCVATGEDRRLGDFFTQAPDANGCVMIATGDTTQWDNTTFTTMPYSLPVIIRQNSGPSLTDGIDCANPTAGG